ncbi:Uncharacterized protein TCAP_01246 [Tolypocladium capitatum]|uniref:Myb-like DNA-binding domain-containing protein n=1 Tax=Tolypocladium capitatum TaxID=45235 RepID=A0A2K3QMS4_9HYPO|nr:Uncharacterized protein TCAP_01246 [Tolypocladium capitatum]
MARNSENVMARFLFAILKQKDLKDINWDQVAQDPVLLESITNGHAARMRFSRFRSTVTGKGPQKRRRRVGKARVSKSAKGHPSAKGRPSAKGHPSEKDRPSEKDHQSKKDAVIKPESDVNVSSNAQVCRDVLGLSTYDGNSTSCPSQHQPFRLTSPYMGDTQNDFSPRFATPCSDDLTWVMSVPPAAVENAADSFVRGADAGPDLLNHEAPSPAISTFGTPYGYYPYDSRPVFQSQDISELCATQTLMDYIQNWTNDFHDPQFLW